VQQVAEQRGDLFEADDRQHSNDVHMHVSRPL
jgi:hypothetical protein